MQTSQDELLTASEKAPSSLLLLPRWQGKARRPAGRGRSQLAESRGARRGRCAALGDWSPARWKSKEGAASLLGAFRPSLPFR